MRICIFGAGAVGSHFAVRLALAGHDVSCVMRGPHLEAVKAKGLTLRVGDAVTSLEATTGYFDVIFIDVDKEGYPQALQAAAPRVRRGGYLLADNVLWSGKVIDPEVKEAATEGIRQFNRRLFSLQEFRTVIVPLRDGVAIARRE